jgi:hypothetical protein
LIAAGIARQWRISRGGNESWQDLEALEETICAEWRPLHDGVERAQAAASPLAGRSSERYRRRESCSRTDFGFGACIV